MPRINLLPVKQHRQRSAASKELQRLGWLLIAMVVALTGTSFWQLLRAQALSSEVATLKQEFSGQTKTLSQAEASEELIQRLKEQQRILQTLQQERIFVVRTLDTLASVLDQESREIYLDGLRLDNNSLELQGTAPSQDDVLQFQRSLRRRAPFLKEPRLQSIIPAVGDGVRWTLVCLRPSQNENDADVAARTGAAEAGAQ